MLLKQPFILILSEICVTKCSIMLQDIVDIARVVLTACNYITSSASIFIFFVLTYQSNIAHISF